MDKEFWKKRYGEKKWEEGLGRANKILAQIQGWGFKTKEFGFMASSTKYSKESPKEKGDPDWEIDIPEGQNVHLETTGTKFSRGADDVWIRNDKFEFAENHPELDVWAGHIIENNDKIRYIKLENKDRFSFETRTIRGTDERFRIIPDGDELLLSPDQFKAYLESKKR